MNVLLLAALAAPFGGGDVGAFQALGPAEPPEAPGEAAAEPEAPQMVHVMGPSLPPTDVSMGPAELKILDHTYETPAGNFSGARRGDYLLRNEKISLVFSRVLDMWEKRRAGAAVRSLKPGALIDVMTENVRVDYMVEFTQSAGIDPGDPAIEYERAEFVRREPEPGMAYGEIGLRLTGPVPGSAVNLVETTYWLAPGQTRARVVSKVIGEPKGVTVHDVGHWGAGAVLSDRAGYSTGGTGKFQDVTWYASRAGRLAIGVANFSGKMKGYFVDAQTRVEGLREAEGERPAIEERWLFIGEGNFSSVTDQIFRQAAPEQHYGILKGRLLNKQTGKTAPDSWVDIIWYQRDPETLAIGPRILFTRVEVRPNGTYMALLPTLNKVENQFGWEGRYQIGSGARARTGGLEALTVVMHPAQEVVRDVQISPHSRLTVRLRDSKEERWIAGRVRFEPVPPTKGSNFTDVSSPSGYYDSFYVPLEGRTIELNPGRWTLTTTAGPRYDYVQQEVDLEMGAETILVGKVPPTAPTPGWQGVQFGAMTRATDGCSLTAEESILMAAGEGLDWIISGDFETATDFAPEIERMGLADRMGSSRGFRTYLPAHPEWGSFLIFPLAADAPDPAKARAEWRDLETAPEFIAALRRLYPGAMIESINPFSKIDGYFFMKDKVPHEMSYDPNPEIELGIDALNLFPSRGVFNVSLAKGFLVNNFARGRFYLPAPISSTRAPMFGEPGYPRLLVETGETDIAKLSEEDLFAAMRDRRWQVTSGPFIEVDYEGNRGGDIAEAPNQLAVGWTISTPNFGMPRMVDVEHEGKMRLRQMYGVESVGAAIDTLNPVARGYSDTLISMFVTGSGNLDPAVPSYGGPGMMEFALTSPFIADANGDGKYDPPKDYRDLGK